MQNNKNAQVCEHQSEFTSTRNIFYFIEILQPKREINIYIKAPIILLFFTKLYY